MNTDTLTKLATEQNVSPTFDSPSVDLDKLQQINVAQLSPLERTKYQELAKKIVVTDINSISNYGSDLQNVMGKYSTEFLSAMRSSHCGEVGTLINNLLTELNYIDVDELNSNSSRLKKVIRKIPLLNRLVGNLEKILVKYDTIASNVDTIAKKITATRLTSLRDNNALQVMFENNIAYGKQIEDLIIAGKMKLAEIQETLETMRQNPEQYESHQIRDTEEFVNNLSRRLTDMMTLRYVIKQSLPQIRTVQYNNIAIADKAQSIIATTIPVWKNQLSIAIALQRQKDRIEAHKKISDATNELLRKNSALLRENSINVAKENERSVIDIETLRETTRELIETIQEVKHIHEEATSKRSMIESEIIQIENDLNQSLIKLSR